MALTGQCKTLLSCASGSRRLKPTRNACNAVRLVAGEHQDEAQASASWCSRPVPSAEAAANEGGSGQDRPASRRTLSPYHAPSHIIIHKMFPTPMQPVQDAHVIYVNRCKRAKPSQCHPECCHVGMDYDSEMNTDKTRKSSFTARPRH